MKAIILDHPKRLELRDFGVHTPRIMAHCQFRQDRIDRKRFWPINDAAHKWRNAVSKDKLWISAWAIEDAKTFVDVEIIPF